MTTGIFTTIVMTASIVAAAILNGVAKLELRVYGAAKLAPKLLLGLVAGVLFVFYLDDAMVSGRSEETVRQLFHLSPDIEVGRIYGGEKRPVCYSQSVHRRTTVDFTPDQYARYLASIDDQNLWRQVQPPHYLAHKSVFQSTDGTLVWQTLPEPPWMGKQQLVWRIAQADVRTGRALCYDINRIDQRTRKAAVDGVTFYAVTSCDARRRTKTPAGGGRVTAALDFDSQRLNIALHFDSKPDYCNNRVTKWLATALGFGEK